MRQKLEVIGYMAGDPDRRSTRDNKPIAAFSLPVNRYYTDASGERKTETTWYSVSAFGRTAEVILERGGKGRLILVETDNIKVYPFLNNEGQPDARIEIVVKEFRFLDRRSNEVEVMEGEEAGLPV